MAGWYKAGKLGDHKLLGRCFEDMAKSPAPQPLPDAEIKSKLKTGEEFLVNRISQLLPAVALTDAAVGEWKMVLNMVNAYRPEIHRLYYANQDHCALMHINMNADNTWWWRDEDKNLKLGVLDWGGLAVSNIGYLLWWSYYAAEHPMLQEHLTSLVKCFCDTYEHEGGPELDVDEVLLHFFLAAMNHCIGMLGAVPILYRQIKKDDWPTVKSRSDPRIEDSRITRMYVMGWVLMVQLTFSFNVRLMIDKFIETHSLPQKNFPVV